MDTERGVGGPGSEGLPLARGQAVSEDARVDQDRLTVNRENRGQEVGVAVGGGSGDAPAEGTAPEEEKSVQESLTYLKEACQSVENLLEPSKGLD